MNMNEVNSINEDFERLFTRIYGNTELRDDELLKNFFKMGYIAGRLDEANKVAAFIKKTFASPGIYDDRIDMKRAN